MLCSFVLVIQPWCLDFLSSPWTYSPVSSQIPFTIKTVTLCPEETPLSRSLQEPDTPTPPSVTCESLRAGRDACQPLGGAKVRNLEQPTECVNEYIVPLIEEDTGIGPCYEPDPSILGP